MMLTKLKQVAEHALKMKVIDVVISVCTFADIKYMFKKIHFIKKPVYACFLLDVYKRCTLSDCSTKPTLQPRSSKISMGIIKYQWELSVKLVNRTWLNVQKSQMVVISKGSGCVCV